MASGAMVLDASTSTYRTKVVLSNASSLSSPSRVLDVDPRISSNYIRALQLLRRSADYRFLTSLVTNANFS
jgi:hypothetical protein